jgi:Ca2+-binding RTX toxin-like protein
LAEFREALLALPVGQETADGRLLARLQALFQLQIDRPGRADPASADPHHEQPAIATATAVGHELAAAPPAEAAAIIGSGPVAAAGGDSRGFVIQLGDGTRDAVLRREDLELSIPTGIDPQLLAQMERDQNGMPNGSWAKIFTHHDFAAIAAAADGKPEFAFDAAAFSNFAASGQGVTAGVDTLLLSGDFSAGFTLSDIGVSLGRVRLEGGNDYALIFEDDFVQGGSIMIVDGSGVGGGNYVMFDGSAETDGRFFFFGSGGNDVVFGGAGDDWLRGGIGADLLSGGGGSDTFIYSKASESSGANHDVLADFDPLADRIDLAGKVTGFDATIQTGTLSDSSFSHDLASALSGLGANHAALFRPDSGDFAGTVFLVVDANGVAGYQEGEDYVFALPATTLADLAGHTDLFI